MTVSMVVMERQSCLVMTALSLMHVLSTLQTLCMGERLLGNMLHCCMYHVPLSPSHNQLLDTSRVLVQLGARRDCRA
jgi:hypothetical protein